VLLLSAFMEAGRLALARGFLNALLPALHGTDSFAWGAAFPPPLPSRGPLDPLGGPVRSLLGIVRFLLSFCLGCLCLYSLNRKSRAGFGHLLDALNISFSLIALLFRSV